jgi:hypothetical protein
MNGTYLNPGTYPHIASLQFLVACYCLDGWMDTWTDDLIYPDPSLS